MGAEHGRRAHAALARWPGPRLWPQSAAARDGGADPVRRRRVRANGPRGVGPSGPPASSALRRRGAVRAVTDVAGRSVRWQAIAGRSLLGPVALALGVRCPFPPAIRARGPASLVALLPDSNHPAGVSS